MGRGCFVPDVVDLCQADLTVDAQHLGDVGGAVAEDANVFCDALVVKTQDKSLGNGQVLKLCQNTTRHCLTNRSVFCQGCGPLFSFFVFHGVSLNL